MVQDDEQELLAVAPEVDHDASLIAERPEQSGVEEIKGPRLVRSLSLWDGAFSLPLILDWMFLQVN